MERHFHDKNCDTTKTEHERRFVPKITEFPCNFSDFPRSFIIQAYMEDELRTRIRKEVFYPRNNVEYTRTRKFGNGISRPEDEKPITEKEFDLMISSAAYILIKNRYYIIYEGIDFELNIFNNKLETYIQIEKEFDNHEEAVAFIPPPWFGREVTYDESHSNYSLAKHGTPKT